MDIVLMQFKQVSRSRTAAGVRASMRTDETASAPAIGVSVQQLFSCLFQLVTPSAKWIAVALMVLSFTIRGQAAEIAKKDPIAVLHLTNGDHVTGTLVPATTEDCLGWQSPMFASPFQFLMGGLESIHFSAPSILPPAEGKYRFELTGGGLLYGSLVALNGETAVVEVPDVGRLNLDRSIIQRISRRGGGSDVLFVGPSGLNGWEIPADAGAWNEDAGHLFTDKPGAILRRDFQLPNQARIELELSWTDQPDFELALGVDGNSKTVSRSFRFDVWDTEIVIQREAEQYADVKPLQALQGKTGRIHVQVFLDQMAGRALVYSPAGKELADLTVTTANPKVYGGLQLTNRRGHVRLERLQIGRWTGETPRIVDVDKPRIHEMDGSISYGTLQSFDSTKQEFVIGNESETKPIAEDRIQDVFLSPSAEVAPHSLRAVYLTGMKIGGDLSRVEHHSVWLKSPGIQEPIEVPLEALQSLFVLKPKTDPPESPQRRARLEIAGLTLQGCLIDGRSDADTSCLVWQPLQSVSSSALQKGIAARIVYRDPPKPPQSSAEPVQQRQVVRALRNVPERQVKKLNTGDSSSKSNATESILHLRTGDTIPCEVVSVDEQGLTFKSAISAATFIPHEQIHAVELDPRVEQKTVDPKKAERLLILPRMQRNNPPTQLFRDLDGDYLRGRLVAINETQIQVELRLEGKIIRRDRVARIIWLHPESMSDSRGNTVVPAKSTTANLVQALHSLEGSGSKKSSQGNRLTFVPEQVEGTILSGHSEIFGACRVDLLQVDELLVGSAIDRVMADLPFGKWKLRPAADPLEPKETPEGSGDGSEGQESALIGKAAPDISLKTLDGTKFNLKDHKEKVVILDFWASWCGPCMQAMPQIDKVAGEFADQGVELFSINLEENPEKIKAALERLKLSPAVLLDRDGRVAERYGATSIPQTVIINRERKVVRVFVGGGARLDEQLRSALKNVLSDEAKN